MSIYQIISSVITFGAIVAAILAWIAKIKWSQEYKDAKEAEISLRIAQIDLIKQELQLVQRISSKDYLEDLNERIAILDKLLLEKDVKHKEEIEKLIKETKESALSIDKEIGDETIIQWHDARNYLNGILGYSELLQSHDLTKEQIKGFAKILHNSGKNLLNHLEQNVFKLSKEYLSRGV